MGQRWAPIILFLILTPTLILPVYGHTTLGDLNNSPPFYRSNDSELNPSGCCLSHHVPGPLGYVWPGSGMDTYSGVKSNPPGYQSPFESYEKPIQVAAGSYSPEGAILTSTADHDNVGDLIFALNFSNPTLLSPPSSQTPTYLPFGTTTLFNYTSLTIYIPAPVFDRTGRLLQDGFEPTTAINWDQGDNSNIVTTITDNYGSIFVTRADQYDPFEPGSWIIRISGPPSGITFTTSNGRDDWYYVRMNQMKAPFTAGRYFFKMFLNDSYPLTRGDQLPSSLPSPPSCPLCISGTVPMENWPVLLVKGEVDPAFISGTIRYGDLNSTLYGLPINLPGRVRAVGIASDPITGKSTGRAVEARGYFNATANGHFEIEGVAAGVYTLYASAAGMPEQKIADNVKVARAQSLHFDGYLRIGLQLRGAVFSRQGFGITPWQAQRPISIIIYDSKSYDLPSIESFSPINLTHAPYTSYVTGNTVFANGIVVPSFSGLLGGPLAPKLVAFPWEGPTSYYSYTSLTSSFKDPYGLFNGVGPAQVWWVDPRSSLDPNTSLGSASTEFRFQFGKDGVYGVPTRFSGMVPQVFATWTDSLSRGKYYIRAFLNGYVQTGFAGTLLVDYSFDIINIGASNVFVPIDLLESCEVNVTVHFHDHPSSLIDNPIGGPDPARYLIAEAFARDGTLESFNFTQVKSSQSEATILLNGLGMAGDPLHILPSDPRASVKYSLARYRSSNIYQILSTSAMGSYDYGLETDMYTIRVFMRGYIHALPPATSSDELDQPVTVNLGVGQCIANVSTHMFRGGGINATATSIDWQRPVVQRNWIWNSTNLNFLVYDISSRNFVDVIYFWNARLSQWMLPQQDSMFVSVPWFGWLGSYGSGSSFIVTNGSTLVDRSGPDVPIRVSSTPGQNLVTLDFGQEFFHGGFLFNFSSYRSSPCLPSSCRSSLAIYPGTYALNGWTYGYVQENVVDLGDLGNVHVAVPWLGQIADISLNIIIGVNLTITMPFKTERIIAGTPYNSSVRIRVFDDTDRLVAATTLISSDAGILYPSSNTVGFFANGQRICGGNGIIGNAIFVANNQRMCSNGPVPAGTTLMTYLNLAGSFQYTDQNNPNIIIRKFFSFSGDYGIWGCSRYSISGAYCGNWRIMVDVVNWYKPTVKAPPVPGLLQGESTYFFPYNHLGPYAQNGLNIVMNAPLSGEASTIFELDLRGYIQATVLAMNWANELRTTSWNTFQIVDKSAYQYYWYTWDGWVDGYLNPGTYKVTIREWANNEGHLPLKLTFNVNPGQRVSQSYILDVESQIPIPEFSSLPVNILCLGAVACLLRVCRVRKRKRF